MFYRTQKTISQRFEKRLPDRWFTHTTDCDSFPSFCTDSRIVPPHKKKQKKISQYLKCLLNRRYDRLFFYSCTDAFSLFTNVQMFRCTKKNNFTTYEVLTRSNVPGPFFFFIYTQLTAPSLQSQKKNHFSLHTRIFNFQLFPKFDSSPSLYLPAWTGLITCWDYYLLM